MNKEAKFQKIGKYAIEKADEYTRIIETYNRLLAESASLDKEIIATELKHDKDAAEKLYKKYRSLKEDISSNRSYCQHFCEKFINTIIEMNMENKNDEDEISNSNI